MVTCLTHTTRSHANSSARPVCSAKIATVSAMASRAAAYAYARSVEVSTNVRFHSYLSHIATLQQGSIIKFYWHTCGGARATSAQRIQAPEQPNQDGSQHPDGDADDQGRLRAGLKWARRHGVRKDTVSLRA